MALATPFCPLHISSAEYFAHFDSLTAASPFWDTSIQQWSVIIEVVHREYTHYVLDSLPKASNFQIQAKHLHFNMKTAKGGKQNNTSMNKKTMYNWE